MTLLVDTSVWSLALRRDVEASEPQARHLRDALFGSEVCIRHDLILLTTDKDFTHAARHCPLRVWPDKSRTSR